MTPSKKSGKHNTPDVQGMKDKERAMDRRGHVIGINFIGASAATTARGIDPQPGYHNYFIGNDKTKWASHVALYGRAEVQGLYPGVDAVFYLDGGKPRYDLVVHPGANTSQIRMTIEGAKSVKVHAKGSLSIHTTMGPIEQRGLYAYQEVDGKRRQVKCAFVVDGKRTVTFNVGKYDRSLPLVIDPLVYSTYLGGSSSDIGNGIAVDGSNNAYITGSTQSTNFPTTTGVYQSSNGERSDAFVTKLNSSGSTLAYSTYLGGSSDEIGRGIAVDGSNSAYITGYTRSTNFPTTTGVYQSSLGGGTIDAFVTKLNSSGSTLAYSTYLGGSSDESGGGIAVDGSNNAYITGKTESTNFPTFGAYQISNAGSSDAFVTKFSSGGNALTFSTYIGGNSDEYGIGIAVDGSGNAYITGGTASTNFPTLSAYQSSNAGGTNDAFVTKLNSNGSTLAYSTYIGGSNYDAGRGIAVDGSGNAYITGTTGSMNFPTFGAYQSSNAGGTNDAFVTKLNSNGSTLAYSTYIGGSNNENGIGIAVDGSNNAYITGFTQSTNFPTLSAYQSKFGGINDAFVTNLNNSGSALTYSTYLGGGSTDYGHAIAVDGSGNAYVTGSTISTNFPTFGAYQSTFVGIHDDAFVTKMGSNSSVTLTTPNGGQSWCASTPQNITWTSSGITNVKIELSANGGNSYTSTIVASTPASSGSYRWSIPSNQASGATYRIRISDASAASTNDASEANFAINALPTPSISGPAKIGLFAPSEIMYRTAAANGRSYKWLDPRQGDIVGSSTAASVTVEWKSTGIDTVVLTESMASTGCSTQAFLVVSISDSINVIRPSRGEILVGGSQNYVVTYKTLKKAQLRTFEYSLDGGGSWMTIGFSTSSDPFFIWPTVPNVATSRALVRITDEDGLVGVSGLFPIAYTPIDGSLDTLILTGLDKNKNIGNNSALRIDWTYTPDIGTSVDVEYSLDYTASWTKIATVPVTDVPTTEWITPVNGYFNPVFIRLTSTKGMTRTSSPLSIGSSVSSVSLADAENGYSVSCYPNPVNDEAIVNLVLPSSSAVRLTFVDARGNTVATIIDRHLDAGTFSVSVNTMALPAGMYTCILQAGATRVVGILWVVR